MTVSISAPVLQFSVDCKWKWSEYSDCSVSCGGGTMTRYPIIIQQAQFGGKSCPENVRSKIAESVPCGTTACRSEIQARVHASTDYVTGI